MTTVMQEDLARPNLFAVVFSSMSNSMQQDGIISNGGTSSATSLAISRAKDYATDYLQSTSSLYRKITGAYSPSLVRGVFGRDFLSFLGSNYDVSKDIGMMAKSVSIPGSSLDITRNQFRRTPQNVITNRNNDNVIMTFYITSSQAERLMFETWMDSIYDVKTSQVSFQSSYAKKIEIYTYDRQGQAQSTTILNDAFPIRIGQVQLDADMNNQVCMLEVEFAYSYAVKTATGKNAGDTTNVTDQARSLYNMGSAAINSLKG